jgi:DNA-binding transcriptional LysR family regulator
MNIEHLRLFIRIAQVHNISQAGHELDLSPAVASAHINKLEATLGVRLIHRTTRKVSLTEEGKAFYPHAEDVIASVEAAQASVGAGHSTPRGTLRVSTPASFGRMHVLPALTDFLSLYPELKIDLKLSDTIVDLVEGGFDIAIRISQLKDSSLIAKKLANDTRILCAAPSYIAKHGAPSTPAELSLHQCISLIGLDDWCFSTPKGPIKVKARGNFRTDNGEAIRDASVNGIGITIGSQWSVYKQIKSGELVHLLPQFPLISETAIWAVYPSSRLLAPKVRAFIDYFSDYFGEEAYWEQTQSETD